LSAIALPLPDFYPAAASDGEFAAPAIPGATDESDAALMQRYSRGDQAAFEALYQRYRAPLYRLTLRLAETPAEAEEIFQEVWIAVIRGRQRYEPHARFVTYLFAIAHRRCSEHWRKHFRHRNRFVELAQLDGLPELEDSDVMVMPDHWLQNLELQAALLAAVSALPLLQREAFLMRSEGNLSLEEIALATAVPLETAKSRMRYAMQKLRRDLEEWR
jgi:RNA polymerase sigma-70 factor, ECF subfamily